MKTKFLLISFLICTYSLTLLSQDITSGLVTYFNMEHCLDGTIEIDPVNNKPLQDLSGLLKNGRNVGTVKGYNYSIVPDSNEFTFHSVMTSEGAVAGHLATQDEVFNRGRGDYSIALWIKMNHFIPTDEDSQPVASCKDFHFLAYNNTKVTTVGFPGTMTLASLKDGKFASLSTNPNDYIVALDSVIWGKWYHFAVVSKYSENKTQLYVNGSMVVEKIIPNEEVVEVTPALGPVLLRRGGGGKVTYYDESTEITHSITTQNLIFDGMMDEFRLYNKALTGDEVALIMAINDKTTGDGYDMSTTNDTKVFAAGDNQLILKTNVHTPLYIYNCTGNMMFQGNFAAGEHIINLAEAGLYLVKTANKTFKVNLR